MRGLDVVIGYQVSWILMFADYSRYTRSPGKAVGRCSSARRYEPLDDAARRGRGSCCRLDDPGAMMVAVGLASGGACCSPSRR